MPILCTVALLPVMLRPFYLVYGLLRASIRRSLGTMTAISNVAKEKVHERQSLLESTGSATGPARRDILAKLFDLSMQKGEKEDFKIPDIQQEGHVGL